MSKSVNRELIDSELTEVTGGMLTAALVHAVNQISRGNDGQGGQNDPAQMFQQIMQQLTQGG